jgi:hypothetical protein
LPDASAVDSDSVHRATPSCHHGTGKKKVEASARAFYTKERLYLRFSWRDPKGDLGTLWHLTKEGWRAEVAPRDGLGILWNGARLDKESSNKKVKIKSFNCSQSCHLRDWRQAGAVGVAELEMATKSEQVLDFWRWRASHEPAGGRVYDGCLTSTGMAGANANIGADSNTISEAAFDRLNSVRASKRSSSPFGLGDLPLIGDLLLKSGEKRVGATASGYLFDDTKKEWLNITSQATHKSEGWTLTLSRPLKGLAPGDVTFRPGKRYLFGLALLDGVASDHTVVKEGIELIMVEPKVIGSGDK